MTLDDALAIDEHPPIAQTLNVRLVDASEAARWDQYVAETANASIYHHWEWRRVIENVFGHRCFYYAAIDERGVLCGVLPTVRLKSLLFGDFMVSLPYFNYGGVLASSEAAASALVAAAADSGKELGVSHLEMRHIGDSCPQLPKRTDKISMHLRLPSTTEALNKQLGSKLRAQIKRPLREGATAVVGGMELLAEFYAVFACNMRDLGTPVYSRNFFAQILTGFPEHTRLIIVKLGERSVAGALVIGYRNRLEVPWASSLREANGIGVNMLLYWQMLEYAVQKGYEVFDFGRSTTDSNTYRFKRQWGAEPVQLHWHYWMRSGGEPPVLNPSNPKYRLAIAAWQRLPVSVANRLGPLLVRNLP